MTFAVCVARTLRDTLQALDIIYIAEQLDIIYEELPLPDRIRGFTGRMKERAYIVVNDALPRPWARAVAFHELGHIQLHNHLPDHFCITEHALLPTGRLERQANEFAAEYLIPDDALSIHSDIRLIAAELDVPVELFRYKRPPRGGLICM